MQFDQALSTTSTTVSGVKLPKLEVPTFDGNIMNWAAFWESFGALSLSRWRVDDAEKLTYLRQALKDESAWHVIVGLSQTAKSYEEAIKYLQECYGRPCLIHQAHLRAIIDAPSIKDGNGRELRRLHDKANQHMREIKAICYFPWMFVTSVLETKFYQTTMFEWKKHSQWSKEVPDYRELLEFLDLWARATENNKGEPEQKHSSNPPSKKTARPAYVAYTDETCVACKKANHPLYFCKLFQMLSHKRKMGVVKDSRLCINCLGRGHFVKECLSPQSGKNVTNHIISGCTSILRVRIVRQPRWVHALENQWTS